MSDTLIRAALETHLDTWAQSRVPTLPIAYEGVEFSPPSDGSPYLAAYLMPASTDSDDLEGAHTIFRGVFQVSIITATGSGSGLGSAIADELRALYPNNLGLEHGGITVFIRSPMATAPTLARDTTSTLPASFQYRADTF